jgi:hypothetical protein
MRSRQRRHGAINLVWRISPNVDDIVSWATWAFLSLGGRPGRSEDSPLLSGWDGNTAAKLVLMSFLDCYAFLVGSFKDTEVSDLPCVIYLHIYFLCEVFHCCSMALLAPVLVASNPFHLLYCSAEQSKD